MKVRYLDWKLGAQRLVDRLKLLRRLFSMLLVQEDGDADRALELLEDIGRRYGLFDDDLTFEDFKQRLLSDKLIREAPAGVSLTPKGERFIRTDSLDQIFSNLKKGASGTHPSRSYATSGDRLYETRPYRFGDDPAEIDFVSSFKNSFLRAGSDDPVLQQDDLCVYESEQHVSVATALLLDISHSMVLYGEDRITPAKRVALALVELIRSRYPKDALHVILFGDAATEISARDLTYCGVGPYHTNTHAALHLARQILLRKKHSNRQIFMITDGKPSALFEDGHLYLNPFGLDRKIVNKTLEEAAECRRHKIPITTFMLARDPLLVRFVEKLSHVNRGRAFFSSLDRLEQTVFVDFLRNRQRRVR